MSSPAWVRSFAILAFLSLPAACADREPAPEESAPADAAADAAAAPTAQVPTVTQRIPQFENENVAVWKTIIAPNQPLNMHRHDNGRVIVALKGGTLKIVPERGEPYTVTWETGTAYWLAADPPGELHGDVNEGSEAMEVMVIEMRR
jgi:quercetin dioxygenase-like cupin family protein